ncbi:MAG: 2-C-methyl-D-erythritol 4-phosphate cytidylyltransferase, partial [Mycoplasma sp.]
MIMNIAFLLAGGNGTRVQSSNIPKQFINIADKPIIIHTLEALDKSNALDKVIITCDE